MSATRKLTVVAAPAAAKPEDVQAELAAAQQAVSAAGLAVDQARAVLDAAPRDAVKRSVLREAVIMAEEDLVKAQGLADQLHSHLHVAQLRADKDEALAGAKHIGRAAQNREAEADADEFVSEIGGAIERFFVRIAQRNLQFRDRADHLNAIWSRLGHQHRIDGVDREMGTGTEQIPPRVCLETLHCWEGRARQKLEYQHPGATPVQQAARQFLLGAIDFTRTLTALKQTRAHNRLENTGAGGKAQ